MALKLLGNSVLLEPIDAGEQLSSASNLVLVNHHKRANLKFKVVAVGPGAFVKRRKKRVWLQPEVEPGDRVLCNAELDPAIVKHSLDDGTGRVLVDAAGILMKWRE